ncbi:MAG: 4-alpha-glucanotransferase, partial [Acidobacteria bacterium]|nr:4-alpha-glucanotransferase [Acidobacteriota bacterium]
HPVAQEYAAFRAIGERLERPWPAWPAALPPAQIRVEAVDRDAVRYHLYAQWAAARQIAELARNAGARGVGLYLDVPVGVHPDGFDVWRRPALFARGAALGAPPDPLFADGQDWSAPAPHPEAARQDRYTYFRAGLAHQMAHATAVRLDHVMGLHRLFWIPRGASAADGAYVRNPADELYAIVCLESHRHRTRVVGENLGTVPRTVNAALSRHGLAQLHVAQFGIAPGAADPLARVPRRAFACVNTHDTPTFAGFLAGRDIDERVERGILDAGRAAEEHLRRQDEILALRDALQRVVQPATDASVAPDAADLDLLRACLDRLARSEAGMVIVNLEDLWLEVNPQNVPGTGPRQHPNWRRRARYALERLMRIPEVKAVLGVLHRSMPGSRT